MSAAAFGYMPSMFPLGWASDRIGARLPMVAGELIAGAVAGPGGGLLSDRAFGGNRKRSLC